MIPIRRLRAGSVGCSRRDQVGGVARLSDRYGFSHHGEMRRRALSDHRTFCAKLAVRGLSLASGLAGALCDAMFSVMTGAQFAFVAVVLLAVYFLPTWSAPRGVRLVVFVVNLTLGWTVLGWLWALSINTRRRNEITMRLLASLENRR
jgi:hypothetical protein